MSTSTGEYAGAAAQPEQVNLQDANAVSGAEQYVPVHVVQAMREDMKALREQNNAFQQHLNMMQWQAPVQQQAPMTQANPWEGVDPDEPIKARDAMKMAMDMKSQFDAQLNELKMASKKADYEETVKKYLPQAIKEDPELLNEIKSSANPYKVAYLACKASSAYQEEQVSKHKPQKDQSADVGKMIANSKVSGNLASVGNNAAVNTVPKYSQMTDAEFRALKAKNMLRPAKQFIEG